VVPREAWLALYFGSPAKLARHLLWFSIRCGSPIPLVLRSFWLAPLVGSPHNLARPMLWFSSPYGSPRSYFFDRLLQIQQEGGIHSPRKGLPQFLGSFYVLDQDAIISESVQERPRSGQVLLFRLAVKEKRETGSGDRQAEFVQSQEERYPLDQNVSDGWEIINSS